MKNHPLSLLPLSHPHLCPLIILLFCSVIITGDLNSINKAKRDKVEEKKRGPRSSFFGTRKETPPEKNNSDYVLDEGKDYDNWEVRKQQHLIEEARGTGGGGGGT